MARRRNGISLDFSDVQEFEALAEGNYKVKVAEIEMKEGAKGPYLSFTFDVVGKKSKLFHNCSLAPQALFNLKRVLEALGMQVPSKAFDLDPDDLVGLTAVVEVGHELYEGKKRARITEFVTAGVEADDVDDEEESEVVELLEDMDLDELKDLASELGTAKRTLTKLKDEDSVIDHILEDYDEEDILDALESEDEDEDEVDYESMTLTELKKEARELGIKVKRGWTKDDILDAIDEL